MKWGQLYIGGLGAYIPCTFESSREALHSGRLTQEEHDKSKQVSAAVGRPNETAPDMSVWAGNEALSEFDLCTVSKVSPELIVHAVALHTGLEAWNGGAYIGNKLGYPETLVIEIRSTCAGSIVGIDILARHLTPKSYGILTAADIWRMPLFDRWASDSGLAYGDGAAALILTHESGPFQVLSTALVQNSRYEKMHRGNSPIDIPEYRDSLPFSMRKRSQDYTSVHGLDTFWDANSNGLRVSVEHALQEAGVAKRDIKAWAVPHFGQNLLQRQCLDPLGIHADSTTAEFGAQVGHTGAADPLLGLHFLRSHHRIQSGDYVSFIGIGAGFTWGCAILRCKGWEKE